MTYLIYPTDKVYLFNTTCANVCYMLSLTFLNLDSMIESNSIPEECLGRNLTTLTKSIDHWDFRDLPRTKRRSVCTPCYKNITLWKLINSLGFITGEQNKLLERSLPTSCSFYLKHDLIELWSLTTCTKSTSITGLSIIITLSCHPRWLWVVWCPLPQQAIVLIALMRL